MCTVAPDPSLFFDPQTCRDGKRMRSKAGPCGRQTLHNPVVNSQLLDRLDFLCVHLAKGHLFDSILPTAMREKVHSAFTGLWRVPPPSLMEEIDSLYARRRSAVKTP